MLKQLFLCSSRKDMFLRLLLMEAFFKIFREDCHGGGGGGGGDDRVSITGKLSLSKATVVIL